MPIQFTLNHHIVTVNSHPLTPLLDVLRNELNLTGTKQGCDYEGECGACTVLLDGKAIRSCLTPIACVEGREVITIEGLSIGETLHPLQEAFIETGAVQCGFCTPGMILSAKALLDRTPNPTPQQIIHALEGNLCRCTGYVKITEAVQQAAAVLRGEHLSNSTSAARDYRPLSGNGMRFDSFEKVTGKAKYAEDFRIPDMLHMKVGRSPYFHARLLNLQTEAAQKMPGVIQIITAEDIPGENGFELYSVAEPILPRIGETVRMRGAPLYLVIAESEEIAQAAIQQVECELQPLPHTLNVNEALSPNFPIIAGDSNILSSFEIKYGDLEQAFAASDLVLESRHETAFLEHAALEREALVGYIDEEGRITVVGGNHQPHNQQRYIANALGLPIEKVRVITPYTGGSFGGKQDPWPFTAVGLAVYHTRRPVRLVFTRQESFDASPKRHPYSVHYQIGATKNGNLTGIKVRIHSNTGGYDSGGFYIPNYALTAAGGAYRWQAVDGLAQSIYTNGPKAGQFRGFGTAQSTFALECALDELTVKLNIDPLHFRLQNCLQDGQTSFLGYPLAETIGYQRVLEEIRPHYLKFITEAEEFNQNNSATPFRRGVGLAGMWYRFGKAGSLKIEAHAELACDGHFVVYASAPDYGQGTQTAISQIAAESLGVDRALVEFINADTAKVPNSDIQGASRALYFVGGAVQKAVTTLKNAILGIAAELLDTPVEHLTLDDAEVCTDEQPSRRISLAIVAKEFDRIGKSRRVAEWFDLSDRVLLNQQIEYAPFFVTGAHLADVQVDLETGLVQVFRVVAVHDVGRAANPTDAIGQIEGAIVMGLGAALMEEFIPGVTTGFSSYQIPTFGAIPDIKVILVEVPSRYGPFGVKGLGEAAMLPSTPAIINGISRAIGQRIYSIPATPEKVLNAIQQR